jgi:hypothetical protein
VVDGKPVPVSNVADKENQAQALFLLTRGEVDVDGM